MGHTLTLEVPAEVYDLLKKSAEHIGQLPEVLAAKLLAEAAERLENDPLEEFVGTFQSSVSDWADHHNRYIGQSLKDSMSTTGGSKISDA